MQNRATRFSQFSAFCTAQISNPAAGQLHLCDRFGRSLRHLVNALAELEAVGVAFVSLTDNLDLSTPAGRLMFQVIAAMGEFERELTRERVRAGLRHARAKGKRLGRPKVVADGPPDCQAPRNWPFLAPNLQTNWSFQRHRTEGLLRSEKRS